MILKGNTRTGAANLVNHLTNERDNDHVEVHTVHGFASTTFADSLYEAEAVAKGTKCEKPFFSLSLNPPTHASVSERDFEDAIDQAANALGLEGQPRAVIFHEKEGRRHCHVVWSRIDAETMKAIPDSFTRYKLQDVSRALFLQHGWELPKGLNRDERGSDDNTSRADQEIAKRTGLTLEDHKAMMGDAWGLSDDAQSFAAALTECGYILGQGKRGFVAIDIYTSDAHSIPRRLGMKKREIEAKIGKPTSLPSVEEARIMAEDQRLTIHETLNQGKPKTPESSTKPAGQKALENLKKAQRQERAALIATQKAAESAQEHSFVQKLFGHIKSSWDTSAAKFEALRTKWTKTLKGQKTAEEILSARQMQTKTHQNQQDVLRQSHLKARRRLQPDLLIQRKAEREKIIFERRRLVQTKDLESRKEAIRIKFEQDRPKGLER